MRFVFAYLLLVIPTQADYSQCSKDMQYPFELCWTVHQQKNIIDILYRAHAGISQGYIALGFDQGNGMIGANAVVGWVDPANTSCCVRDYYLGAKRPEDVVVKNNQNLTSTSIVIDHSNFITMTFTRPLEKIGVAPIILSGTSIIWASGEKPRTQDSPLQMHTDRGKAIFNFEQGHIIPEQDPWKQAHATLMGISFGILFPFGLVVARYFEYNWWFKVHRGVQITGAILSLCGFAIALIKLYSVSYPIHLVIGCIVMFLIISQMINAVLRPEKNTPNREKWNMIHHWMGRIAIALGFLQIFVGIDILKPGMAYLVICLFGVIGWSTICIILNVLQKSNNYDAVELENTYESPSLVNTSTLQ